MRAVLPWLLIVLAAVLGYLLFAPEDDTPAYDLGFEPDVTGEVDPLRGVELKGAEKAAQAKTARKGPTKAWQPPDPRTLPTGTLIVRPLGPDLKPLVDRRLGIIVTPRGQKASKLGLFDEASGAWRFERVIAGTVDLRITGDHILGRSVETVVKRDDETVFDLHLERGGAVRYTVTTYADTKPEQVLVELFDATGHPHEAWFQVRSTRKLTQPRKTSALTQAADGIVFGIRPGRYRLKVTNVETDEWDDVEVGIEAGETASVELQVRR